jgi:hypothetical protein
VSRGAISWSRATTASGASRSRRCARAWWYASAERRIGAALALAATGDDAQRERVRIAASACASPRMRIALERIAGGDADDQAVDEALATEAEQAARTGR